MWRELELDEVELPPQLRAVTTSVWEFSEVLVVGVMRSTMIGPPCLWANVKKAGIAELKEGPKMLNDFQQLIHASLVYAEAETSAPKYHRFLEFLGFTEISKDVDRKLYQRNMQWLS